MCVLASSLTACSSESLEMTTADLGKRWKLQRASDACNAEIEQKRWGSVAAILTYEQHEPDHGYATFMAPKLN
jgi:hypothetical protein